MAPFETKTISYWGIASSVIPEAGSVQQSKAQAVVGLGMSFGGSVLGKGWHELSVGKTYWFRGPRKNGVLSSLGKRILWFIVHFLVIHLFLKYFIGGKSHIT